MSRWECIVCGLIYDEKEGWPDDGIAPGTRWEDVPEDWLCPDCGVGKEDFELLEESPVDDTPHHEEPVADKVHPPVVILGTGLAGYGLAKEYRRRGGIDSGLGSFYRELQKLVEQGFVRRVANKNDVDPRRAVAS